MTKFVHHEVGHNISFVNFSFETAKYLEDIFQNCV